MRKDQIERLNDLAERIGEVFIEEADPQNWSGAGLPLSGLDTENRGNRYWDKKNAIQTGSLLARVIDLAERDTRAGPSAATDPDDAEKDIRKYEKQAKDLLDVIQSAAKR